MLYEIKAKSGYAHLWSYERFKEDVGGQVRDYNLNGNLILSVTYSVVNPIPQSKFDEYSFIGEIISE